jgi:4-coumarate--CoA ligase
MTSSGTTGLPKAVLISHGNMLAQCLQAKAMASPWRKNVLGVLPFFHITGLAWLLHIPILLNLEVYMLPYFEMRTMLKTIVEYGINELLLVPPLLIRLVRDEEVTKWDLSCVKAFSTGAAPVSQEILNLLEKRFPGTAMKQGYGMTESCSCITGTDYDSYAFKYGTSVGSICASTEIKIIKDDDTEGGVGEEGELLARGPQITMGYLNNEKATRETYEEGGWLRTGDIAVVDENGRVWIRDRKKELIKVKGIGVAPAELEDLLLGHPLVEDVAVLGVLDDYSGELPKAYVKVRGGGKGSEELGKEVMKYVREKKTKHKWVKEVEFVDEIPKSASGKILRRVLRDQAKTGKRGLIVKEDVTEKAKL